MSTEKSDGGPAFPTNETERLNPTLGMSLRDYFAAAALPGVLGNLRIGLMAMEPSGEVAGDVAHAAYKLADAMLAERAKVKP